MTTEETIDRWRKRATDELAAAKVSRSNGQPAAGLIHCAAAIDATFRALFVIVKRREPSPRYTLLDLAQRLAPQWAEEDLATFRWLMRFATVDGIRDLGGDTRKECDRCIAAAERLFSRLLI